MKIIPLIFLGTMFTVAWASNQNRIIQYAGTHARDVIYAVAGTSARLPLNMFVACNDETECAGVILGPTQTADPDVIRKIIASHSSEVVKIEDEKQLRELRVQLDRLGSVSSHIDAIQASCADISNFICKVTPFEDDVFE